MNGGARDFLIGKAVINHQLFDVHRMRADLGYTDIVPPLEGLAETVRWYRDNPPELDAEYEDDLAAHYRTEDELVAINAEFTARLANVEHVSRPYKHPYAHPKTPNQSKDHRKR